MRTKYLVIFSLLAALAITVYKMMEYEKSIRKKLIIEVAVEDKTKPLLPVIADESLKSLAISSDYYFSAKGNYFEALDVVIENGEKKYRWKPFLIKGVNLGVALPGHFPAEFAVTYEQYLQWFQLIGQMHANVIRTYTILPPDFYNALARYNLTHAGQKLYLLQGVWASVPDDDDYFNPEFSRGLKKEIIDVIDLLHGRAVIDEKPGHAQGVYSTDVSRYVTGILLGREWEPRSVEHTNLKNKIHHYNGKFVCLPEGTPMEAWLAELMDFTVQYETVTYHAQRPVSFVNWLPLDPMFHNTEYIENSKVREYDNDLESIDFTHFQSTELFYPGIFASYHAYPYYPDFINLEPAYVQNSKDNYFEYLKDLKNHNKGIPLVIAEYGMPSSRGNSHFNPYGLNQGGHSETEQAKLSLLLTRDIFNSGCAGAVYFEWIDEWFKHNWLVMDFEQPFEDRKLWHNMENPEQNYGIMAMESRGKIMDGHTNDWNISKSQYNKTFFRFDADPSYFNLLAYLPDFDFQNQNLYIALDVLDKKRGDHKLPFSGKYYKNGFEFLVQITRIDSALILVDEPFSVFTDIYNDHVPVYATKYNQNGQFVPQLLLANRGKEDLFGNKFDSMVYNRSWLKHGNNSNPNHSNADFFWNDSTHTLEMRLTWHLLNVSDPAKTIILDDREGSAEIEYSETKGFNINYFITDKNDRIIQQYPPHRAFKYKWAKWDKPEYKHRLKPLYDSLGFYFASIQSEQFIQNNSTPGEQKFEIAAFYENKKQAVSICFNNASWSAYAYAIPVLDKYHLKADFGVVSEILTGTSGNYSFENSKKQKRLSLADVKKINGMGHELVFQTLKNPGNINQLEKLKLDAVINTGVDFHILNLVDDKIPEFPVSSQFTYIKTGQGKENSSLPGKIIYSVNPAKMQSRELFHLLESHRNEWLILDYYHLFHVIDKSKKISSNDSLFFISDRNFERQLRLVRNTGAWIAPMMDVKKYLDEKQMATVEIKNYENIIFLKILCPLSPEIYNFPLTVIFTSSAPQIKVTGSENPGCFVNRTGKILVNTKPGKEVMLELLY